MFREVLDCSVTVPDRSETQSPTGSMRTIRLMKSTSTHSGSAVSGSRSTTFLPPMECTPDFSGFQSLSRSSAGSLSRQPLLRSRTVDDAAISNQTIVYPGDPRVIAPSRSSSLHRTSSLTDLGEEFKSTLRTTWIGLWSRTRRCHRWRRFTCYGVKRPDAPAGHHHSSVHPS